MNALRKLSRPVGVLVMAGLILTTLTCATDAGDRRTCLFDLQLLGVGKGILCETPGEAAVVDTACQAFEPIRYSRKDSAETQAQIRAHNAAWDALCKDK